MTLRTKLDTGTALDTFLVFDVTEPLHASLCKSEEEARDVITWSKNPGNIRVHRVTLGELVRDVTADFLPDDDDEIEPFAGDYSHADHFGQLLREAR